MGRFLHPTCVFGIILIPIHDGDVLEHGVHISDVGSHSIITKRLFRRFVYISVESVHTVINTTVVQVKLMKYSNA